MYIYKLTNTLNNKIYIGLTTETINERCRKRNVEAKFRKERTSYILNAIRKYGEDKFKVEQIDTANNLEELKLKEIHYIKLYNSTNREIGYNLTEGGEGNKGLKMSDQTKDKIRQKHLGKKISKETKKKMSESHKNREIPIEQIERLQIHNKVTSKPIVKLNDNLEVIKTYNSISEVVKEENIDRSGISVYLKQKNLNKKYKGSFYKYK